MTQSYETALPASIGIVLAKPARGLLARQRKDKNLAVRPVACLDRFQMGSFEMSESAVTVVVKLAQSRTGIPIDGTAGRNWTGRRGFGALFVWPQTRQATLNPA
jgi:hypothetical protein